MKLKTETNILKISKDKSETNYSQESLYTGFLYTLLGVCGLLAPVGLLRLVSGQRVSHAYYNSLHFPSLTLKAYI